MMRLQFVLFVFALAATGARAEGWGFILQFVQQLRDECNIEHNLASETWAKQSTTCSYQISMFKISIADQEKSYSDSRNLQERKESESNSFANQVAQHSAQYAKTDTEKASLLQQISKAAADFDSMDAEYGDNIAVLQKAIQFNMDQMDANSCVPKKTTTTANVCGNADHNTESMCAGDSNCRWERPVSMTKIQKMLNTLQDKFRTERIQAHDNHLNLVHTQQLAKLSLTQMMTALDAQKKEAASMLSGATTKAGEAKIDARNAAVSKDELQKNLVDLEVQCKFDKEFFDGAQDRHTECGVQVNEMESLVQQNMAATKDSTGCGVKPGETGEAAADQCPLHSDQGACENDDLCRWQDASEGFLLFLQLSTVSKRAEVADPMELLHRAGKHFGDDLFLSLLQKRQTPDLDVGAPVPTGPDTYSGHSTSVICQSITNLIEARAGCAPGDPGCDLDLDAQAGWTCEGLICEQKSGVVEPNCAVQRTQQTCADYDNGDKCVVSDPTTCQSDLANVSSERGSLEGTIAMLENKVSDSMNTIITKETQKFDKRTQISLALSQIGFCQSDYDDATARYEADQSTTRNLMANSQTMIDTVMTNFGSQVEDTTSTAYMIRESLVQAKNSLELDYAKQETAQDAATFQHSQCLLNQRIMQKTSETQRDTLESEIARLELERAESFAQLGNTKRVHARTSSVENAMNAACNEDGGAIAVCKNKFKHAIADLNNAYSILCTGGDGAGGGDDGGGEDAAGTCCRTDTNWVECYGWDVGCGLGTLDETMTFSLSTMTNDQCLGADGCCGDSTGWACAFTEQ